MVFDKRGCLFVLFLWPRRVALAVKAPSPKHWTAREFPKWGELEMWGLTFSSSSSVAKLYKRTMAVDQCALCVRKEITVKMKSSLALEPTYHTKENSPSDSI